MTTTEKKVFLVLNSKRSIEVFNLITSLTDSEVDEEFKRLIKYGYE